MVANPSARNAAVRAAQRQPQQRGGLGPEMLTLGSGHAVLGGLEGWISTGDPTYPSDETFPGLGTFPQGPDVGGEFLSEELSPYARLAVEAAFGGDPAGDPADWVWVDISSDVRQDAGVKLRHGRSDEAAKTQPATMSCVLDNREGNYSKSPGSLNYPYVRRGTPIRVTVNLGENLDDAILPGRPPGYYPALPLTGVAGTYRTLFAGHADGFSPEWDTTGRDATASLEASGVLRRLSQGSAPAPSQLRRYVPRTALIRNLIGYWPMEDGEHSTTVAAGLPGVSPMTVIGQPTFAKAKRFRQSDPMLQVHGSTLSAPLRPYAVGTTPIVIANFVVDMEDDGEYPTTSGEILRIWLRGGTLAYVGVKVRYDSDPVGIPTIFARAVGATSDIVIGDVGFATLIDFPVVVRCRIQQVGANVRVSLSTRNPGAGDAGVFTYTLTGQTFTHATKVTVGQGGNLNLFGIGHLAVQAGAITNSLSAVEIGGYREFDGELAHNRIARIAEEESIPCEVYGTSVSRCGEQGAEPILDVLTEAAEVDQGILLDGLNTGLTYVTRAARESRSVAMTLDVSKGELAKELGVADDDQSTRNSWEITRKGGQKAEFTDEDGPMGTNAVGLYDSSKKVNLLSDTDALDLAAWLVRQGTVTGYRFPRLNIDLAKDPHLAASWVTILPSSRIDLVNMRTVRTQLPEDSTSLLVEGYQQNLSRFRWDVTVNCSPAQPWEVGEFADDEGDTSELVARLGSDGTTLTEPVALDGTSMEVVTPVGPTWTTTGDDYPMSLDVGGHEVVATACTATNDDGIQTFTIEPSPGVLRLGSVVDLYRQPAPGL